MISILENSLSLEMSSIFEDTFPFPSPEDVNITPHAMFPESPYIQYDFDDYAALSSPFFVTPSNPKPSLAHSPDSSPTAPFFVPDPPPQISSPSASTLDFIHTSSGPVLHKPSGPSLSTHTLGPALSPTYNPLSTLSSTGPSSAMGQPISTPDPVSSPTDLYSPTQTRFLPIQTRYLPFPRLRPWVVGFEPKSPPLVCVILLPTLSVLPMLVCPLLLPVPLILQVLLILWLTI